MNKSVIKVTIIGDSISQGLGKKKINYCESLKNKIENLTGVICNLENLAVTGKTIIYANEIIEDIIKSDPDIILLFMGSVDALIRPKPEGVFWKCLPKRYKLNGMLDPRPFYSKKRWRYIPEHIDSWIRWHLKKVLMKFCKVYSWVDEETFENYYRDFVRNFSDKEIFAISPVYVDEKFFPGSNYNLKRYRDIISKICSEQENTHFFDIYSCQEQLGWKENPSIYGDDHFHPSIYGYQWMGSIIGDKISQIIKLNKK